jgi:hypothetical protein
VTEGLKVNKAIICIAAIVSLSGGPVVVAREDLFAGPLAGNCGDDVQCTADFEKIGKHYEMKVRVSDHMNDKETVCQFIVEMKPLAFDLLVGDLDGDQVKAVHMRTQDVVISGLPKDECSGAVVNGAYRQFFDE